MREERGDGWRVILGDCLQVMPTLEAGSVDAVITDIPYGMTACAWDTVIPFTLMWEQVKRLLKPRGAFVTTASQPFTSALVMSNMEWFRYEWIWAKTKVTGYLDANRKPLRTHEEILVFSPNPPAYNPQMVKGQLHKCGALPRWHGQGKCYGKHERIYTVRDEWYPRTVLEFPVDPESSISLKDQPYRLPRHPTQKPIALYAYLIRTYTNEGDTVLDFCFGSGTTGVACVQTGRRFIGIEIDEGYFEIGLARLRAASAQLRLPGLDVIHAPAS